MTTSAIFGSNGPIAVAATPMQEAVTAEVRRPLSSCSSRSACCCLPRPRTSPACSWPARPPGGARWRSGRARRERRPGDAPAAGREPDARPRGRRRRTAAGFVAAPGPAVAAAGRFSARNRPRLRSRVVAFALLASLLASLVFGVMPALQVRRLDLVEALSEDGSGSAGPTKASRTAGSGWQS